MRKAGGPAVMTPNLRMGSEMQNGRGGGRPKPEPHSLLPGDETAVTSRVLSRPPAPPQSPLSASFCWLF